MLFDMSSLSDGKARPQIRRLVNRL